MLSKRSQMLECILFYSHKAQEHAPWTCAMRSQHSDFLSSGQSGMQRCLLVLVMFNFMTWVVVTCSVYLGISRVIHHYKLYDLFTSIYIILLVFKKYLINDWDSLASMGKSLSGDVAGVQKDLDHDEPFEELWFCSERNGGHGRWLSRGADCFVSYFGVTILAAVRKVYGGMGPEDGNKVKSVHFRLGCTSVNHCLVCRICSIYNHTGTFLLHPCMVGLKHWVFVHLMGKMVYLRIVVISMSCIMGKVDLFAILRATCSSFFPVFLLPWHHSCTLRMSTTYQKN